MTRVESLTVRRIARAIGLHQGTVQHVQLPRRSVTQKTSWDTVHALTQPVQARIRLKTPKEEGSSRQDVFRPVARASAVLHDRAMNASKTPLQQGADLGHILRFRLADAQVMCSLRSLFVSEQPFV